MKGFKSHIEFAGRKHGLINAFNDFMTFAVCALSLGEKEDEYLKTSKKYTSDEMISFSHAFASLIEEMDNKGEGLKDCLGDYFIEIQGSDWHGQFFTPEPLCDMIANITKMKFEDNESINDPCCGSGRMLLSAARQNRNCIFYGADIDYQCCQMTLINLCLNGLTGYVSHMDTLKMEEWKRWSVGIHPIHLVPYIHEIDFSIKEKTINQTMLDFYELQQPIKKEEKVKEIIESKYANYLTDIDLLL